MSDKVPNSQTGVVDVPAIIHKDGMNYVLSDSIPGKPQNTITERTVSNSDFSPSAKSLWNRHKSQTEELNKLLQQCISTQK